MSSSSDWLGARCEGCRAAVCRMLATGVVGGSNSSRTCSLSVAACVPRLKSCTLQPTVTRVCCICLVSTRGQVWGSSHCVSATQLAFGGLCPMDFLGMVVCACLHDVSGLAWVPSDDAGTQLSPVSVETFGHVLRAAAFVRVEHGLAPWSCIVLNVCHSAELAGRCA